MLQGLQQKIDYYYSPEGRKVLKKEQTSITVKIIETILSEAAAGDISDIHIEPHEEYVLVRFRIDGILYDVLRIEDLDVRKSLSSSIKAQASMHGDGTANKKAQDGRWSLEIGSEKIDFRISIFPVVNGEKVVMRIFRQNKAMYQLAEIGCDSQDLQMLKQFLTNKNGILFVTGPTGSGKTSTLYASLNHLNDPERNIVTLEDPVEFKFDRINQSQIDPTLGFDFSDGLRAILRQDPDIILVGEIRDVETAEIAIRASLTGHLVLTTIHTNDAPTAVTRLLDMGIEPFLIAASTSMIINQRLIRRMCQLCKKPIPIPDTLPAELELIRSENLRLYRPEGCDVCNNMGYKGRLPVFEFLKTTDDIKQLILKKKSASEIRHYAIEHGMKTLVQDTVRTLRNELTSLDEVVRILSI